MHEEFKEEVAALAHTRLKDVRENQVVFYGSSSFRLWETLSEDFPELDVINLAFGGSKIIDCSYYYDSLLGQTKPSKIIFYAGDNDIADEASAETILQRFKDFLQKVDSQFPEVPLTFLSIKPSPIRAQMLPTIQKTNELINAFLETRNNRTYLDIHFAMLSEGNVRPELFTEDELHMNPDGYSIWTAILRKHLLLD